MAFTLIELIVTVGIIIILAALLIPSVNSAINSARNAKCESNLRALGTAVNNYSGDNSGYFPSSMTNASSWYSRLAPYLNIVLPKSGPGALPGAPPCPVTVFLCPCVYQDALPQSSLRSYAFNSETSGAGSGASGTNDDKIVNIAQPSRTALICDTLGKSWLQGVADINYRHASGQRANILFFDGHVQSMSTNDVATYKSSQLIDGH